MSSKGNSGLNQLGPPRRVPTGEGYVRRNKRFFGPKAKREAALAAYNARMEALGVTREHPTDLQRRIRTLQHLDAVRNDYKRSRTPSLPKITMPEVK